MSIVLLKSSSSDIEFPAPTLKHLTAFQMTLLLLEKNFCVKYVFFISTTGSYKVAQIFVVNPIIKQFAQFKLFIGIVA